MHSASATRRSAACTPVPLSLPALLRDAAGREAGRPGHVTAGVIAVTSREAALRGSRGSGTCGSVNASFSASGLPVACLLSACPSPPRPRTRPEPPPALQPAHPPGPATRREAARRARVGCQAVERRRQALRRQTGRGEAAQAALF